MKPKAQSSIELVIIFACTAVVILVMGNYVLRGLSGKYKRLSDSSLDAQFDPAKGTYEQAHHQSGKSASLTRVEKRTVEGDDVNYLISYQVAGPRKVYDDQGDEVTELTDDTRPPLVESTASHTELDWEDLEME